MKFDVRTVRANREVVDCIVDKKLNRSITKCSLHKYMTESRQIMYMEFDTTSDIWWIQMGFGKYGQVGIHWPNFSDQTLPYSGMLIVIPNIGFQKFNNDNSKKMHLQKGTVQV